MRTRVSLFVVLAVVAGPAEATGAEDEARLKALGQHRSRGCTTCHRIDGRDIGIPPIVGQDVDTFIKTLSFYKNGKRTNPVMVSVTQALSEEDMRALALYFGSLPKPKAQRTRK